MRTRWAAPLALVLAALAAVGCDDEDDEFFGDPPDAPRNLTSFTGDGEVILVWEPSTDAVESYAVYAFIESTDDFEIIGITTSTAFVDEDVVNGDTYRYRVTAVDFDGDESDFSNEAFDTPRPAALNVLLESAQVDAGESALDLTTGTVVSAGSPDATFRFDDFGGVPMLVPLNGAEVQNVGFVDRLACRGEPGCTELNFAPESGYFPEAQQAFVGDAYVFRIPDGGDRFFGAVRVSHLAEGIAVLDWTFQPDEGNRELLVRPAP
jgi:hypothetical protein